MAARSLKCPCCKGTGLYPNKNRLTKPLLALLAVRPFSQKEIMVIFPNRAIGTIYATLSRLSCAKRIQRVDDGPYTGHGSNPIWAIWKG